MLYRYLTVLIGLYALYSIGIYITHEHRYVDKFQIEVSVENELQRTTFPSIAEILSTTTRYPIEEILALSSMQNFLLSDHKLQSLAIINDNHDLILQKKYQKAKRKTLCKKFGLQPLTIGHPMPRLYYATLFNSEIDVLAMSLYEMADTIYSFVLVEANATFMGYPREFQFPSLVHFLQNFTNTLGEPLTSKIVYHMWAQVGLTEYYAKGDTPMPGSLHYGREEAIRDSIRDVFLTLGLRNTDIVIISDSDEFVSREFLTSLRVCDAFPQFKNISTKVTTNEKASYKRDLCTKNKIQARSFIFSYFLDCPQVAKYGSNSSSITWPGIRFNWHPDAAPGFCLLDKEANTSIENIRTRAGSKRMTKQVVGWHYRNLMPYKNVLKKYQTYSHPGLARFNLSAEEVNINAIQREVEVDCANRKELLRYISPKRDRILTTKNIPSILFSAYAEQYYKYFYDAADFYSTIQSNTLQYA